MPGLAPSTPLSLGGSYGYILVSDIPSLVKQNLKMLLLTAPGERMMDPNFGVGLRNYLFEQKLESVYADITSNIEQQVSTYMPFVNLVDVLIEDLRNDSTISENSVTLRVVYSIPATETQDQIDVSLK